MEANKSSVDDESKSLSHPEHSAMASVSGSKTGSEFRRGKCKWFNVTKGWGFIMPDDGTQDVFVHQSVLEMAGFRSLGENEIVEFKSVSTDKGLEATLVTGPDKKSLEGSSVRGNTKKRFRKTRCYNCGQFANHIAAHCTFEAQPKNCHYCKSVEHLMAECPQSRNRGHQSQSSG